MYEKRPTIETNVLSIMSFLPYVHIESHDIFVQSDQYIRKENHKETTLYHISILSHDMTESRKKMVKSDQYTQKDDHKQKTL